MISVRVGAKTMARVTIRLEISVTARKTRYGM